MRKILSLIIITVFVNAHWLKDIPQTITQSNGQTIQCFASGDQYAHRLHDKDDYTIVLNSVDGDFYYAEKIGEKIQPSEYKVGLIDPKKYEFSSRVKSWSRCIRGEKRILPSTFI